MDTTTDPCVRTVLVAELYEITVTSVPAYPDSGVELARRSCMSSTLKNAACG
ncbi:HK97 family phage prohead protease [Escherichia coli]|nr:HK97 family phage prohead protease [Escherichia coli]